MCTFDWQKTLSDQPFIRFDVLLHRFCHLGRRMSPKNVIFWNVHSIACTIFVGRLVILKWLVLPAPSGFILLKLKLSHDLQVTDGIKELIAKLKSETSFTQPVLVMASETGTPSSTPLQIWLILDWNPCLLPCDPSDTSESVYHALYTLFACHFVFNVEYDSTVASFYEFMSYIILPNEPVRSSVVKSFHSQFMLRLTEHV